MKSKKIVWIAGMALLAMVACKNGNQFAGYQKSETGLYSKFFITHEGARKPKFGEFAAVKLSYYNSKDSLIFSSLNNKQFENGILVQPVFKSPFNGSLEEGFMKMGVGDSASFKINADSLYLKAFRAKELPKFIEKGSYLTFYVKLVSVQTEQERFNEFTEKENAMLKSYINFKKIDVAPTETGMYFIQKTGEEGKGPLIKSGQTATVKYTGSLLDGRVFDTTEREGGKPFTFQVGMGQVIKGWDEALLKMKKGGKAHLILPSSLGYGIRGDGDVIPPFSPLVFDVEVVDVK